MILKIQDNKKLKFKWKLFINKLKKSSFEYTKFECLEKINLYKLFDISLNQPKTFSLYPFFKNTSSKLLIRLVFINKDWILFFLIILL